MLSQGLVAAMRTFAMPQWLLWVLLAVAVLFAAALAVVLFIIARRSTWPDRDDRPGHR